MKTVPVSVSAQDIHPFDMDKSGPISLGGIEIPCEHALKAHSDGDVVIHALVDAILGILAIPGQRDIGSIFPDDDPQYKDAKSKDFLEFALTLAKDFKVELTHINIQIACKTPRLSTFYEEIAKNITDLCSVGRGCVNIQAMSNNGCDASGRGEAVSVLVSVSAIKPVEHI